jgi:hypothetical protein
MICKLNLMRNFFLILILLLLSLSSSAILSYASGWFASQVGAAGGPDSVGNVGVRAEIRTHSYHVDPLQQDAFWVGDDLNAGGFIQFGYVIEPEGRYCYNGEIGGAILLSCPEGSSFTVNGSEAMWLWEYWPVSTLYHFYFSWGHLGSVATNGTWNSYVIMPDAGGGWQFLVDGQRVSTANFTSQPSRDDVRMTAEKSGFSATPGPLGPVEFRNLTYLREDAWHSVTALYAYAFCLGGENCPPVTYGVALDGPNQIIAGTSVNQAEEGKLLWSSMTQATQTTSAVSTTPTFTAIIPTIPELLFGGLAVATVAILLVFEFVVLPRRKHPKRHR